MKTNFKTGVLALALMVGATGVFANNISNAFSGKKTTDVNWQRVSKTTGLPFGPIVQGDGSNPFPNDCIGDVSDICAQGTVRGQSTPTLFYYYN